MVGERMGLCAGLRGFFALSEPADIDQSDRDIFLGVPLANILGRSLEGIITSANRESILGCW